MTQNTDNKERKIVNTLEAGGIDEKGKDAYIFVHLTGLQVSLQVLPENKGSCVDMLSIGFSSQLYRGHHHALVQWSPRCRVVFVHRGGTANSLRLLSRSHAGVPL